jgi:hypothetical protein
MRPAWSLQRRLIARAVGKHDGYRLIARKEAGRVVLWSRYATDYSDTFLRIAEAVRSLPESTAPSGRVGLAGPDAAA